MKDAYRLWTPSQVAEEKFTDKHLKKKEKEKETQQDSIPQELQ